jgi:hypothetical protein
MPTEPRDLPQPTSPEDAIPPGYQRIEVRVAELRQLFNAIDPSPFTGRDLDPRAEEFIVGWGRDLSANAPIGLVVHLERGAGPPDEAAVLRDAVHEFFRERASATRRRLRGHFRRGRISLAIGLAFLAAALGVGDALARYFDNGRLGEVLRESLLIGGWVAMWRPLEMFLYDWWPIQADARLFDRLGAMPVRLEYEPGRIRRLALGLARGAGCGRGTGTTEDFSRGIPFCSPGKLLMRREFSRFCFRSAGVTMNRCP